MYNTKLNDQKPKIYYKHIPTGDIYRCDYTAFTMDGEKRVLLKNIGDGTRWDIAWKDLFDTRLIDGKITDVWEPMPAGWYPAKNTTDYINSSREEFNVYGVPAIRTRGSYYTKPNDDDNRYSEPERR